MDRKVAQKLVMGELASVLKPTGFSKRKGRRFFAENDEVVRWVELQLGRESSDDIMFITVNMGAYCLRLGRAVHGEEPRELDILNGHWNIRLGHLLPHPEDTWWTIRTLDEATAVGKEITKLLKEYGIPASEKVSTTSQFRELFRHGKGLMFSQERSAEMLTILDKLIEEN